MLKRIVEARLHGRKQNPQRGVRRSGMRRSALGCSNISHHSNETWGSHSVPRIIFLFLFSRRKFSNLGVTFRDGKGAQVFICCYFRKLGTKGSGRFQVSRETGHGAILGWQVRARGARKPTSKQSFFSTVCSVHQLPANPPSSSCQGSCHHVSGEPSLNLPGVLSFRRGVAMHSLRK